MQLFVTVTEPLDITLRFQELSHVLSSVAPRPLRRTVDAHRARHRDARRIRSTLR